MPKAVIASAQAPQSISKAGACATAGDEGLQSEVLKLAMEASKMVWWDWRVPENRMVFHGAGDCI